MNFLRFSILLLLFLLPLLHADQPYSSSDCSDYEAFLKFCRQEDAAPNDPLYQQHKEAFEKACNEVKQHNEQPDVTYNRVLYCNSADVLPEETTSRLGLFPLKTQQEKLKSYSPPANGKVSATVLPTVLNYVTKGQVTSVKNQGSCGCCWSFASVAMYESQLLMRGFSYGISEQASLECTSYYAPGKRVSDCSGGYFEDPLRFLAMVGGVLRSNYPYIAGSYGDGAGYPYTVGICNETNRISVGNGTSALYGSLSRTQIKQLLNNYGPVMVGLYANTAFTQYSSGVFSGCPADAANFINHAVLLVGYNDNDNSWLIKNQWSSSWGESGYIRISYFADCGINALLGNIVFSSFNANPSITISPSLLFSNSPKWEQGLTLAFVLLALLAFM